MRSAFLRKILEAKIGADLAKDYRSSTMNSTIDWLAREQPADWLPKEFQSYKDLFMASELTAIENLTRKYGADRSNWIWGNERKINFVHPLSNAPLIGGNFIIASISGYGSGLTPNVGSCGFDASHHRSGRLGQNAPRHFRRSKRRSEITVLQRPDSKLERGQNARISVFKSSN